MTTISAKTPRPVPKLNSFSLVVNQTIEAPSKWWRRAVWLVLLFDQAININVNAAYTENLILIPFMIVAIKAFLLWLVSISVALAPSWPSMFSKDGPIALRRRLRSQNEPLPFGVNVIWLLSSGVWTALILFSIYTGETGPADIITRLFELFTTNNPSSNKMILVYILASAFFALIAIGLCRLIAIKSAEFKYLFVGRNKFWFVAIMIYSILNGLFAFWIRQ